MTLIKRQKNILSIRGCNEQLYCTPPYPRRFFGAKE